MYTNYKYTQTNDIADVEMQLIAFPQFWRKITNKFGNKRINI